MIGRGYNISSDPHFQAGHNMHNARYIFLTSELSAAQVWCNVLIAGKHEKHQRMASSFTKDNQLTCYISWGLDMSIILFFYHVEKPNVRLTMHFLRPDL